MKAATVFKLLGLIAGLLAFGALVVAGQYAGATLFAQIEQLPESVVSVWTLLDYWQAYGHVFKVRLALIAGTTVSVILPAVPLFVVVLALLVNRPKRELHGSARFARVHEIRKYGLLDEAEGRVKPGRRRYPSIIVGKYLGKYLTFAGQQFVMLAAPTRSKKGVAVVIPNLLTYPDSVVELDIKGEGFDITSKYRQQCGQQVFRWAPFDEGGYTHCWNPLEKIAKLAPHIRIGRLQMIAARLYHTPDARNKFFYDSAADLFLGVALYLMETTGNCTFGQVLREAVPVRPDVKLRDHLADMMNREVNGEPLSGDCLGALGRLMASPDETMLNITKTFTSGLMLFANPIVDAATSRCDFQVDQVRRQPMSIYLVLPAAKMAIAGLLANLFFTQWIEENLEVLPEADASLRYQCLGILDEATSVGKIEVLDKANAFIAGYNIRLLTILQSKSQGEDAYGKLGMRTLVTNHALKIIYPPRDTEDAKEVSETLGYFTEKSKSSSRQRGRNTSVGESTSDQRRALMMAQELEQADQDEEFILGMGLPIRCEKATYYEDPQFIDRLKSVCPMLAALGDRMPTEEEMKAAQMSGQMRAEGIEILDIAKIHAERSAKVAAAVRASRQAGAAPLTAKALRALNDEQPASPIVAKVFEAALADLFDLGETVTDELREMFAPLTSATNPSDWPVGRPAPTPTNPPAPSAANNSTHMTTEALYHHG
ncbi:type IV secretory system conjugative DNA transfer family protein [Burkholderia cepacia]|jgi:type IV secretion system protein VirD4|uniref:Type IV secretory system conjugative DNA transfer protein n=2 Tax=cellular organisms TaxID=131567 RepID=A0A072TDW2_MEDTR|nr:MULTISPECIES: type IV secretory system conjugative DNA transfer family protein [Burkholderia]KEH15386.1 type IV secretory system conjugative DNA transfer protein [Medicago truncatula]EKS9798973.1 type IV secretory system conjugative DNA transfer family protein [Burkholderia cepacia]EKS9805927.1 type IV secretory system conjugative DNA transfer family protein [Burkholderia cepacia]EKS9813475.1 type IV secretory system conjugative DNA transfer family protein [Burkholderia cepacia]EKS9820314.1